MIDLVLLRFLDFFGSFFRFNKKRILSQWKWGARWPDFVRSGRKLVRVQFDEQYGWRKYSEPGWEWICQNCKEYSIITDSMVPKLIKDWESESADLRSRGNERYIRPRPTAQTARCPNCRFSPGDPE